MMKKLLWASLLVFTLLILTAAPAFAAGPLDGRIVFGESFTLESGEVLDGDLIVLGGSVDLEEDSRVAGDVAVMGGSADIAGTVDGDMVVFGGSVDLTSTAVVDGELITFGGNIDRAEGAIVRGNQVEGFTFGDGFRLPSVTRFWTNGYGFRWDNWLLSFFFRVFKALATVVLVTIIGALVVVFLPRPLERVSQAVLVAPLNCWVVGMGASVLAALIGGILIATLCLSPFGAIIWLAVLITGMFGWIALGLIIGLKVLEQLKASNVTPVMGAIVGAAILSLLTAAIWIVSDCCLGWPFIIAVGSFGLGAVLLTRLGTQEYVPTLETPTPPQPPVSLAEDEGQFAAVEPEDAEILPESTGNSEEPSES
jgi:cytoskeletal protein CcmA (bactofilin family)